MENNKSETSQNGTDTSGAANESADAVALILKAISPGSPSAVNADETELRDLPEPKDEPEDRASWDESNEEHKAALAALKRDGMTQAMIDRLGLDDGLKLAKTAGKRQRDYDKRFSEAKIGKDEASNGYQVSKDAFKPLVETFGLDEKESDALVGAMSAAVLEIVKPYTNAVLALAQHNEATAWSAARKELVERIPQLAEDDSFEAVRGQAEILIRAGIGRDLTGQARINAAIEAAAKISFDDIPSKSEVQRRQKLSSLKKVQPNSPTSPASSAKSITDPVLRIREAMRLQAKGLGRAEILQQLG